MSGEFADAHMVDTRQQKKNGDRGGATGINEAPTVEEDTRSESDNGDAARTTSAIDNDIVNELTRRIAAKQKELDEYRRRKEKDYEQLMQMYDNLQSFLIRGEPSLEPSTMVPPVTTSNPQPSRKSPTKAPPEVTSNP